MPLIKSHKSVHFEAMGFISFSTETQFIYQPSFRASDNLCSLSQQGSIRIQYSYSSCMKNLDLSIFHTVFLIAGDLGLLSRQVLT